MGLGGAGSSTFYPFWPCLDTVDLDDSLPLYESQCSHL